MVDTIIIQEGTCWVCGLKKATSSHHSIPQRLNPKKNVVVPICDSCHKQINSEDLSGMYSYAHKIEQIAKQTRDDAARLKELVAKFVDNTSDEKSV